MQIKAVIWDLGNVLIDWNPEYVFRKRIVDATQRRHFFEQICTSEWNEEQDAGRSLKEATELLVAQHPQWKEHIEAYYGEWTSMLGGAIQPSVEILRQMKEQGKYKLYALTNWSGELFPIALERYEFLHWFDGRVVSGDEKMRKPESRFYQLLLDRYGLQADEALFIDDNLRNIQAAAAMGINCIRFDSAGQLRSELIASNILQQD